jgi:hypothetical protein
MKEAAFGWAMRGRWGCASAWGNQIFRMQRL